MAGEIGARLRVALNARHPMRAADLARALDVKPQRLNGWLTAKHDPDYAIVVRAAEVLNISREWLLGEQVPMNLNVVAGDKPVGRSSTRYIPIYGALSAGRGDNLAGEVLEWYEMRDWGGEFERWGRVISGFSMDQPGSPTSLRPGDFAIFEDRQWEPGHIVHAFSDGVETVKQIRRIDGKLRLCPTNPEFESFLADGWKVKGVCIGFVRKEPDGGVTERLYKSGMRPTTIL